MKFKDILQEIKIDTGVVGQVSQEKEVEKPKKKRRRVFGSWFTSHDNKKHLK